MSFCGMRSSWSTITTMSSARHRQRSLEVCGIARTVAEAVELGLRHKPDLAVIDLRLADGELGTEVAALLDFESYPR